MSKVFAPRKEASKRAVNDGESLAMFLARMKSEGACDPNLTWEELAVYNWGTRQPNEVNRALIELIGCKGRDVDKDNPQNSILTPFFGLGQQILLPKAWKKEGLALEKTHTLKLKKPLPAPAISITRLPRWFIPEDEECPIEFETEGVVRRASKVDFEVYATKYFERQKGGELTPSKPHTAILREVFYKEVNPSVERITSPLEIDSWKGEAEATHGILEAGSEARYINYACAPYTVLMRYYKKDTDGDAVIHLEPFYPCWHSAKDGSLKLDPRSLVVKWAVEDDNNKLKVGQLIIWNNEDKPVFRAVLSDTKLREGKYDLPNEEVYWPEADVDRTAMPYRVQIQAHSDMNEDDGLALAVMHTQVRACEYDRVQCIAFDIQPGTTKDSGTEEYLGDKTSDDADIARRCAIMKDAITLAYDLAEVSADESVLKIFMAPEFYFRGTGGAYPIEKVSGIVESMREETDKIEYADWLFVFGTAVGQLAHEKVDQSGTGTGQEIIHGGDVKHNATILEVDNSDPPRIRIECRLPPGEILKGGVFWGAMQKSVVDDITKCDLVSQGPAKNEFWLTLKSKKTYTPGPAFLLHPTAIILDGTKTQKIWSLKVNSRVCSRIAKGLGWKLKQGDALGEIEECTPMGGDVYLLKVIDLSGKMWTRNRVELIEPITTEVFNVALVQKGWPAPSPCEKGLHAALVYKEYISHIDFIRDKAAHPAWDGVVTIDDEDERRLLPVAGSRDNLGAEPARPGPAPKWTDSKGVEHTVGSEINKSGVGGGSVLTIDDITFGLEVCLDHGNDKLGDFYDDGRAASGDPKVQIHLIPSWGIEIGGGKICCVDRGVIFNVDGSRCDSIARINDGKWSCDDHEAVTEISSGNCPVNMYACHGYQSSGTSFECPVCHTTAPVKPPHDLKPIGSQVGFLGEEAVASSNDPNFFAKPGKVRVYDVCDIPPAEFVS